MSVYQKIIAVQKSLSPIAKNAKVKDRYGKEIYSGLAHDDVTEAIRELTIENNLFINFTCIESSEHSIESGKVTKYRASVKVKGTIVDADDPDGRREECVMPASAEDFQDKAYGKAITMASKYILTKTFMCRTGINEEERIYDKDDAKHRQDEFYSDTHKTIPINSGGTQIVPDADLPDPPMAISGEQHERLARMVNAIPVSPDKFLNGINNHLGRSYTDIKEIFVSDYQLIVKMLERKAHAKIAQSQLKNPYMS